MSDGAADDSHRSILAVGRGFTSSKYHRPATSRVFAEYLPQTRIEGEVQQMDADFPVTELWQVLAGHSQGRQSAQQVTIFDSVGFALEDFSALRYLHHVALEQGVGSEIHLVPQMQDPKNLFGVVAPRTSSLRRAA